MKTSVTIMGCMTRSQLADLYKMSGRSFNTRLKRLGISLGSDRILLPEQIRKIVEALGPWEIIYSEE